MADTTILRFVTSSRPLLLGISALLLGQLLFLFGFGALYVMALVFVLAIGLPYPKLFSSLLSRLVVGFLLALSIVQVAASVQFLVLPDTKFGTLSLLVTALTLALLLALRNVPRQPSQPWNAADTAGIITALFFVLPLGILCFWQNDLTRIATFASIQGSDGGSHYTILAQSSNTQHLDYRTAEYYPRGFHLSSAFMMHGLHLNQHDQDWATNARVYAGMYLAWGAIVAYLMLYLAAQLRDGLPAGKRPSLLLLALGVGPVLAGLYLFTLTQEGFLSFFYIIALLAGSLLFLYDFKLESPQTKWYLVAYLLLAFGIAMSWGPLLTPVLLAIPLLYLWSSVKSLPKLLRMAISKQWLWVTAAFTAQLLPLYFHLRYATLSAEQGLNATGGLKEFHYGLVLAGLALTIYLLCSRGVPASWQKLTGNAILPLFALVGAFVAFQLVTVGEVRYYGIKISYMLEIILLVVAVVTLGSALHQRGVTALHRWVALPLAVGLGVTLLVGLTANPLDRARVIVGNLIHIERVSPDVRHYATLGSSGQLQANTVTLHHDPISGALAGNSLLTNWSHLMQYTTDSTPETGLCHGRIFVLQTYRAPSEERDRQLIAAVKDCIAAAKNRGKQFIVITDTGSVPRLRDIFGETAIYVY
jgi:uncharacterized membrane protein